MTKRVKRAAIEDQLFSALEEWSRDWHDLGAINVMAVQCQCRIRNYVCRRLRDSFLAWKEENNGQVPESDNERAR